MSDEKPVSKENDVFNVKTDNSINPGLDVFKSSSFKPTGVFDTSLKGVSSNSNDVFNVQQNVDAINSKKILSDLGTGQVGYINFNFEDFKVEKIMKKSPNDDGPGQFAGFRLFLNLNSKISFTKTNFFNIRVKMIQEKFNTVPHYYLQDIESISLIEKKYLSVVDKVQSNEYFRVADKFVTLADIIAENSKSSNDGNKKTVKNYTIPHLSGLKPPQSEEESKKIIYQFKDPADGDGESLLTSLYDFSSVQLDYSIKLSKKEALKKIDEYLFNQHLHDEAKEIKKYFNFNIYVENDRTKIFSGAILYGPPGTGKTYTVKNSIIKIFEEVLGFNVERVNMAEALGGNDSMYVGAMLRATNSIFMPAMDKIQKTGKPCLIFVDEGDKLVKNRGSVDNHEAITAMKNYINPSIYPGIVVCIATNLERGEIDGGIGQRRLALLHFDYPNYKKALGIWKGMSNLIFKNPKKNNFSDSQYATLANIVAGNVGIDTIDTFTKGLGPKDNVDFEDFKYDFFNSALGRVEHLAEEKLGDLNSGNKRISEEELKIELEKIKSQKNSLIDSYRGNSNKDKNGSIFRKVMNVIVRSDGTFFKQYETLFLTLKSIFSEFQNNPNDFKFDSDLVLEKLVLVHTNLREFLDDFEHASEKFNSEITKDYSKQLNDTLKFLDNFVSNAILVSNNHNFLKKTPFLMGRSGNKLTGDQIKNFFIVVSRLPEPKNLFIEFTEKSSKNKNLKNLSVDEKLLKRYKEFFLVFFNYGKGSSNSFKINNLNLNDVKTLLEIITFLKNNLNNFYDLNDKSKTVKYYNLKDSINSYQRLHEILNSWISHASGNHVTCTQNQFDEFDELILFLIKTNSPLF